MDPRSLTDSMGRDEEYGPDLETAGDQPPVASVQSSEQPQTTTPPVAAPEAPAPARGRQSTRTSRHPRSFSQSRMTTRSMSRQRNITNVQAQQLTDAQLRTHAIESKLNTALQQMFAVQADTNNNIRSLITQLTETKQIVQQTQLLVQSHSEEIDSLKRIPESQRHSTTDSITPSPSSQLNTSAPNNTPSFEQLAQSMLGLGLNPSATSNLQFQQALADPNQPLYQTMLNQNYQQQQQQQQQQQPQQ